MTAKEHRDYLTFIDKITNKLLKDCRRKQRLIDRVLRLNEKRQQQQKRGLE